MGGSYVDLWIIFAFGIVGYLMRKFDYPAAPLLLALVLGPIMEKNLKLSLKMSQGSLVIFFERPITLILIALIVSFHSCGRYWYLSSQGEIKLSKCR